MTIDGISNDVPKALIIGINSFLGAAIFKQLTGYEVTGVYHQHTENIPAGIHLLVQVEAIHSLQEIPYSYIFIVSSYIPFGIDRRHTDELIKANIKLPETICNLFPRSRIIFMSSVSVYEGVEDTLNISEYTPPSPKSPYAITKLWGEQIVNQRASYLIVRISSMYGFGMNTSTFLPRIIDQAIKDRKIQLYGDGSRLQSYVHVDDVAKIAVIGKDLKFNGIIHAVNDQSYTNLQIAEIVKYKTSSLLYLEGEDNTKSFVYKNTITKKIVGSFAQKKIEDGINELITWRKNQY